MRTAAYSITAVSVVNRPEKASQNRTIVKIGIELQSVDSPRQSQRIRLHRPSCPAALQKDYAALWEPLSDLLEKLAKVVGM